MNLEQIFKDQTTDAVYICSPDSTHFNYTKTFLVNRKHVICEKPISSNYNELANIANSTEKVFMIGFNRRFDDRFLKAKKYLLSNKNKLKTVVFNSFDTYPAS